MTTSTEHKMAVECVTVLSKMTKRDVASLVRSLTDALAETPFDQIDVRIDLRNEYGGARSLISVNSNSIFGSFGVITDSRIIEKGE
jgi:hypothetical protein